MISLIIFVAALCLMADDPPGSGTPFSAMGKIDVQTRTFDLGFGPIEGRAYFLKVPEPIAGGRERIALVLDPDVSEAQQATLDRLAASNQDVRISGDWIAADDRKFLRVKTIREFD